MSANTSLPFRANIVIIGAGIVGCGLAKWLSQYGEKNIVVLEKGPLPLTGGSTSHAPGLVFQNNNRMMSLLAQDTVHQMSAMTLDDKPCFHTVGGIEIASTNERMAELWRRFGSAKASGMEATMLSAKQVCEHEPLIDVDTILGGLYTPEDGIAEAMRASEYCIRQAKDNGVNFIDNTSVVNINVINGAVDGVATSRGYIQASRVVSTAGMWGPKIGAMAGVEIPLVPMQHQLVWTNTLPTLSGETSEVNRPMIRHQGHSMYWRQKGDHLGIGTYRHAVMPVSPWDIRGWKDIDNPDQDMPSTMQFTPNDFDPSWEEIKRIVPDVREVSFQKAINGLFSFTPDAGSLVGETEVDGFWVAEAVWITHSLGVARNVAQQMIDGHSEIDLTAAHISRFHGGTLSPAYVLNRSSQAFAEVYDIKHPEEQSELSRNVRTSPFYARERSMGAIFREADGWERPQWYESNSNLVERYQDSILERRDEWSSRHYSPIVAAEHLALRDRVGLVDMTSLTQVGIAGPDSLELLQKVTTRDMDQKIGKVTYALMLTPQGGIKSDVTVTRLGEQEFRVGCNGQSDIRWLNSYGKHLDVTIRDISDESCCIGVWGPKARQLVQSLTVSDMSNESFGFFNARSIYIENLPVLALRVSYVGELGWELYTKASHGSQLWDLLWQTGQEYGAVAVGRGAFNSLRIEKGYRSYGADMTTEHTPDEAGLSFAVKLSKQTDFVGRDALSRSNLTQSSDKKLVPLKLADPTQCVMGGEPVYSGAECIGYVTSSSQCPSIGQSIAYAWLPIQYAQEDTSVAVHYFGKFLVANVAKEPLFDPSSSRMKC